MNTPADPAVAIDQALTDEERAAILGETAPAGSLMHGAKVADLLAMAYDHDAYTAVTDPFFKAPEARVLLGEAGIGAPYAAITLAMSGKQLTVPAVRELLGRAGLSDGSAVIPDGDVDELSAALEEIRQRREDIATRAAIEEVSYADFQQVSGDADILQAALDMVLKVVGIWESTAADLRKILESADANAATTAARGAIVSTSEHAAKQVREAITRELGKGNDDG